MQERSVYLRTSHTSLRTAEISISYFPANIFFFHKILYPSIIP